MYGHDMDDIAPVRFKLMTRRLGRIKVSKHFLSEEATKIEIADIQRVFNNLLVLDVQHDIGSHIVEYLVMCMDESFEPVTEGEPVPEYDVIITRERDEGRHRVNYKFVKKQACVRPLQPLSRVSR